MAELKSFIAQHTAGVRQAIEEIFVERKSAAEKLTPHLVESVKTLEEFSLRGGKYIRPMLVLLAAKLAGAEVGPDAYRVSAGVELFHKHILNLDDMADRDELRNGGPTVWKAYEQRFADWKDTNHHARSFAEIDGTLLGSFAFELVRRSQLSAEQRLAIMDVLNNQMYFETVAGWQIHYYQNQQSLAEAKEDEFLHGLDLVTSRYTFVGPLQIGLLVANVFDPDLRSGLDDYGLNVGLAFQLTDDVLGVFGDPKITGKAVGNDIREGKKTLLLQTAYRKASVADKTFLADVCGRDITDQELQRVQNVIRDTGAFEVSQQKARNCITDAKLALTKIAASTPAQKEVLSILAELADSVIDRQK